ncbi:glycosyltransferase [Pseudoalteromonas sp. SR43-6]|uniref:glycosyltransferase n=1 Tax=unclassified Pseudoalteromonas TaxID=194690 RepID=UPI0015FCCF38|nr:MULTISPECIES: glycosyltransferase [unclassified Pseudoalteromonas]MBB1290180.1 glycosyltransferase [Pseudoalteromonas sp. SR41-5]MBB1373829.1 glycosyltransferase [Pseudoalteromonas sp. SR43-6]MBB1412880.1 glycosyltransferase [Pseudoalteromonas sp. SG43-8]
MKKIVHIINAMEIGGVEVGVLSLLKSDNNYHVITVKGADKNFISSLSESEKIRLHVCNGFLHAIKKTYSLQPDIICSSLWRGHIVNLCTMFNLKKVQRVAFIHSTNYAHRVDFFINKLIECTVDKIFCDSKKTLEVVQQRSKTPSVVVPMNVTFNKQMLKQNNRDLSFVYIGRFSHSQKNLRDALKFIKLLKSKTTDSVKFTLFGRDDGDLSDILKYAKELQLESVVQYCGELNPVEVENKMSQFSFFLQTSLYEGMCITCFQAIKSGLIPVINPVGEMVQYTKAGMNSFYIKLDELEISVDDFYQEYINSGFERYSRGTLNNEKDYPVFSESFFNNIY